MNKIALKLREFLIVNCKNLDLHRVRLFPHGSCETSSLLLGKILQDVFPMEDIYFVEGTNSQQNEQHYWIEVRDQVFDITADQFEEVNEPSFGNVIDHIQERFDVKERVKINMALLSNNYASGSTEEFSRISESIREN